MGKESTESVAASSPVWETLEAVARQSMQQLLQRMLEAEVDGVLGRGRYERRAAIDASPGYRNGRGQPRRLSLSNGTITLRRPRVRGLSERFESRLLPAFKRRAEEVGRILPELYLHRLARGDFDLALRGLLGAGAPLSASSIARLKAGWQAEYERWKTRSLADLEVVSLWVDGVYVKAGPAKEKAAILVVLAALRDGRKVILAVESGCRESTESWGAILRDLKRRGTRGAGVQRQRHLPSHRGPHPRLRGAPPRAPASRPAGHAQGRLRSPDPAHHARGLQDPGAPARGGELPEGLLQEELSQAVQQGRAGAGHRGLRQ